MVNCISCEVRIGQSMGFFIVFWPFLADFRSFWAIEADFRSFRAIFAHSKGDISPFRVLSVIFWSFVSDFRQF